MPAWLCAVVDAADADTVGLWDRAVAAEWLVAAGVAGAVVADGVLPGWLLAGLALVGSVLDGLLLVGGVLVGWVFIGWVLADVVACAVVPRGLDGLAPEVRAETGGSLGMPTVEVATDAQ